MGDCAHYEIDQVLYLLWLTTNFGEQNIDFGSKCPQSANNVVV